MALTTPPRRPRGRPAATKSATSAAAPSKGLDRSLRMLEILAAADGLSLTDVALSAGVASSTAHRILTTLEAHKFVTQDEERDLWFIGVNAFAIGNAFLRNRRLVDIGRRTMRRLMQETGESVNLAIEDDGAVVYISQVESHSPIRSFHRPGSRGAIHASGVGKAFLAAMSDEAVGRLLHKSGLQKFTDQTITEPKRLFRELAEVRSHGWAVDDEERNIGMRCVAAVIYDEHAEVIAALSLSGPTSRITRERLGELGPTVKRAAAEITASIGGRMP